MKRFAKSVPILLAAGALSACADQPMGPSGPTAPMAELSAPGPFEPADFAWATRPGRSSIEGVLAYRGGGGR